MTTPAPKVTRQHLENLVEHIRYEEFGRMTVCLLTTFSGFTVLGYSACADPANFDQAKGEHYAYEAAFAQLWPLEGYRLRCELAALGEENPAARMTVSLASDGNTILYDGELPFTEAFVDHVRATVAE